MITRNDYLVSAAQAVEDQVAENPTLGVPVDPDVAEYMGAVEEDPRMLDNIDDETDPRGTE